jgi:DNA-binding IclR family transcriptional regulator
MIQRHLATMDHVELLMLLRARRDESFSAVALAEQIRKPEQLVRLCLDALARAGLAAELSDGTYRYAAREQTLDGTAEAVVRLYNERPVTLVRLLYERPPTAVNTFADAFKLRKD